MPVSIRPYRQSYQQSDRIGYKVITVLSNKPQIIQPMGPLPQTPDDIIVALTLLPFVPDQSTMCETCAHGDD